MIGHILDNRYKILEKVGTGGMASVYKARDILLDRIVAVKTLHEKYGNDHDFVVRFRQEAQAAAKLSHPNIVNIYDVGFDENVHYIVMEFVRGETLKEYIDKHGHLPIDTSIRITFDIGEALEHAHRNGIVHCDIKPHNILVTETGRIKVADFGIARAINSSVSSKEDSSILGSVHYFAPEQASGGPIDERTDIYSLGVVMYEMMTGVVPFQGDTAVSIALKHVQEDAPLPSKYNRRIPPLVERCILKAMAKRPDDRFQSIEEMMSELRLSRGFITSKGAQPIIKNNFNTQKIQPVKEERQPPKKKNIFTRLIDSVSSHSQKTIMMGMLGIFIVAFLGAFFSFGNFWSTEEITVPDVTGKQVEIAKDILQKKNLLVSVSETDSSDVPIGQIITQTPPGGSVVKARRTIYLTVSKGHQGEEVLVPDLRGLTVDEAKEKLKDIGLTIGRIKEGKSSTYKKDTIISQTPASSSKKVAKNTSVDIVVNTSDTDASKDTKADSSDKKAQPNVVGMPLDAAVKALESAGYKVGAIANQDGNRDNSEARVTSQNPDDSDGIGLSVDYSAKAADQEKTNNQETAGAAHSGTVNISVPSGASSQHVQIVVADDNGSRVVYDKNQSGGDSISRTVNGVGKTRVKVYINGSLVQDQYV